MKIHVLSHKCRIYPKVRQYRRFQMILGICQDLYNSLLAFYKEDYKNHKIPTNLKMYFKEKAEYFKKTINSMKHLDDSTIDDVIINVIRAVRSTKNPEKIKFKNEKRKTKSFLLRNNPNITLHSKTLNLAEYGEIKLHYGKTFDSRKIVSYRVLLQNNKWFIIITTKQINNKPLPKTGKVIGVDLGIKNIIILSNGRKYDFPNISKINYKLKKMYQKLFSKEPGSNRYERILEKINILQSRRKNIINNYYHQISTKLVKEFDVIAMENLDIQDMIQDSRFSINIFHANWYKLVEMIRYKCKLYGKIFIQVHSRFPSSKRCNNCGYKHNITINDRMWECPKCGHIHDRDINAAKNILDKALEKNRIH